MTYRYEWRAMSYAFFMHEDYPPFDFELSSDDDGWTRALPHPVPDRHLDRRGALSVRYVRA